MSGSKRRQRKERARTREAETTDQPSSPPQQAQYDWRTFPVFFAFSAGGFVSLLVAESLGLTVVFAVFGGMLGFGLSRLGTRALASRGIIKPR